MFKILTPFHIWTHPLFPVHYWTMYPTSSAAISASIRDNRALLWRYYRLFPMRFKEQRCLTTIITDIKMLSKFYSCTAHHKIPCISQHNRWHLGKREKRAELGLSCGKSSYWPEITALSWENPRLSRQVGAWPRSGKHTGWKSGRTGRAAEREREHHGGLMLPSQATADPHLDWQGAVHGPAYNTAHRETDTAQHGTNPSQTPVHSQASAELHTTKLTCSSAITCSSTENVFLHFIFMLSNVLINGKELSF